MTQASSSTRRPLLKSVEVCEIAKVQPYVLRSWEKEFPGIGVQKSAEGPRLYRQADVDQVLRIKQLVFGEGLTLAGARRRLEESVPAAPHAVSDAEVAEVLDALASAPRVSRTSAISASRASAAAWGNASSIRRRAPASVSPSPNTSCLIRRTCSTSDCRYRRGVSGDFCTPIPGNSFSHDRST